MRRADDPARLRRARRRHAGGPQHQTRHARAARGQSQLAADDQIEGLGVAEGLQHDAAQRIAGQRVGGGAQRHVHVGRAHHHHEPRIETELAPTVHRQRAAFAFGKILPHPQQRALRRNAMGQPCDEAGRRRAVTALRKHLMHRAARQPTLQRGIDVGMPQRHPIRRIGIAVGFDALDAAAQTRKRVHACAGHAPLLKKFCQ
jgi:hypothetical protein